MVAYDVKHIQHSMHCLGFTSPRWTLQERKALTCHGVIPGYSGLSGVIRVVRVTSDGSSHGTELVRIQLRAEMVP